MKIVLPEALLPAAIKWHHHMLRHCDTRQLLTSSIAQHLYSLGHKEQGVNSFCCICDAWCQRYKNIWYSSENCPRPFLDLLGVISKTLKLSFNISPFLVVINKNYP